MNKTKFNDLPRKIREFYQGRESEIIRIRNVVYEERKITITTKDETDRWENVGKDHWFRIIEENSFSDSKKREKRLTFTKRRD